MFVKTFKNNYFLQIILLSIIPILLWMPAFISAPEPIATNFDTPIYKVIYNALSFSKTLSTILAFVLIIFQGFLINSIFSSNQLSASTTFFPAFIYILLLSSNHSLMTISPLLIINTFILIAIFFLFRSFDKLEGLDEIFTSNLFVSLAFLTFTPSILFVVWIWLTLLNYRFYKWRYWIISLLGLLTPVIILIAYYFITDLLTIRTTSFLNNINFIPNLFVTIDPIDFVFYIAIGILSLASLFNILSSKADNNINYRKKTNVIVILFLISILPSLYSIGKDYLIYFLAPSLSLLFYHFFMTKRKLIYSNIIFSALFLLIITKLILSLY
ncbi:MAG: hypothetical protein WCS10_03005 [Bacteroidales bacterium]|jgi:hypothetical protein|nr:hypothetical protein [Bacteroidales bacterium]MDD4002036.1 hypothetical protein [Bacteroidales bacterium]MDD4830315.1 hypothetical protein [Bacteroidales bacterium]